MALSHKTSMIRVATAASVLGVLAGCATSPVVHSPAPEPPVTRPRELPQSALPNLPPAGSGRGGYYQDDGPGDAPPPNLMETPDAEPKIEPYAKSTSKTYQVFGKTYTPITDERPFKQRGIASWYGKKFHGQRTSSGERYDMYKMTAAHPLLPIPSYARVTSLESGKTVIVRINDRGPFHANRITDLSFTAALKLGLLGKGSHEIEIERLLPDEIARMQREPRASSAPALASLPTPAPALPAPVPARVNALQTKATPALPATVLPAPDTLTRDAADANGGDALAQIVQNRAIAAAPMEARAGFYVQLGAYSQASNAEIMRSRLAANWQAPWPQLQVVQAGAVYRLYSGPFDSRAEALDVAERVQNDGLGKALVVQR